MSIYFIAGIAIAAIVVFTLIVQAIRRYKRCPSDKLLVIYGRTGKNAAGGNATAKCVHGGAAFIWPIVQDYQFLDLKPISIPIKLTGALSKQNIRIDVPSVFTVAISTEPAIMTNAAERLLGLDNDAISALAEDIILGQLRLVIATMDIEEINSDRDKFLGNIQTNLESELSKIGLKLINVNITDINDESGYIIALGKNAAAKATNDAIKLVAEQERDGQVGEANANQEKTIRVAEAKSKAKIGEAQANAEAVQGENEAAIKIADSNAAREVKEAEARKKSTAAQNVQAAQALEESYAAEKKAEDARAEKVKSAQYANVVVPAEIEKQKVVVEASAEAERTREIAKGEGDAIFIKMEKEALGIKEILSKQAEGIKEYVDAAGGNPDKAIMMMMVDKLPELYKTHTEAVQGIDFGQITVWDTGGNGGDGSSTSNFVNNALKSVPPFHSIFESLGLELPKVIQPGTTSKETEEVSSETNGGDNDGPQLLNEGDNN